MSLSQTLSSAKSTQAKISLWKYTEKKPGLGSPRSWSLTHCQLSHSERFYWLRLLPHHLCFGLSHTDNYLGSASFIFPPREVNCVQLLPFRSAFRKENFYLLKSDSPVFSLGVLLSNGFLHIWAGQLCCVCLCYRLAVIQGRWRGAWSARKTWTESKQLITNYRGKTWPQYITHLFMMQVSVAKISLGVKKTPHLLVLYSLKAV